MKSTGEDHTLIATQRQNALVHPTRMSKDCDCMQKSVLWRFHNFSTLSYKATEAIFSLTIQAYPSASS